MGADWLGENQSSSQFIGSFIQGMDRLLDSCHCPTGGHVPRLNFGQIFYPIYKRIVFCSGVTFVHFWGIEEIIKGTHELKVFLPTNSEFWNYQVNPKRCGLFGLLDMRGGGRILPGLRKRSITPPNAFLEQQTESHMKAEVFS